MRAIVTMNIGGSWIPPNVMESHLAAAGRWGCEYLQLVDPGPEYDLVEAMGYNGERMTNVDVFALKRQRIGMLAPAFDRIVWLDGDVIVRFDCPSLFDLVPEDAVGGVANYQGEACGHYGLTLQEGMFNAISAGSGCPVRYDVETYINGGVVIYTPEYHQDIWVEDSYGSANGEQTFLNWKIAQAGHPLTILPPTFNRVGPEAWAPGPMRHFIQHLAHFKWTNAESNRTSLGRGPALEAISWLKAARQVAYA